MKTLGILFISCLVVFATSPSLVSAQSRSEKETNIQKLLNSKNFTFVAESANPMSGSNIRLTSSYYHISFYKDSIDSFLPYFGTAFRSQYGMAQSPLIFTSADFSYEAKTSKKGSQTVTIKINTPNDPDVLTLFVSPAGYGTLQVNSIDRQPISFYGVITPNRTDAN
jgi:hypothetical protein